MAIFEVDGGYVASSRRVWIPGVYESERAATYAFRFSDRELRALQESVSSTSVITYEMLTQLRRRGPGPLTT